MPQLKLNKCNLHYKILGRGKPIIFIHGWNGSSDSFQKFDFSTITKGYKVYLIDLPGYGKSPPIRNYSFQGLCNIINNFMEEKKIKKADLFGLCSGASICMDFCIRNPSKVKRLFLVEPCFSFPKSLVWLCYPAKKFPFLGIFLFYFLVRNKIVLRIICNLLSTNKKVVALKQFTKEKAKVSVDYMLMLHDYSKINHYKRLNKIKYKKAVIFIGKNTGKDIKKTSEKIRKVMKNCQIIKIKNASHFPVDENFEEFEQKFITELS